MRAARRPGAMACRTPSTWTGSARRWKASSPGYANLTPRGTGGGRGGSDFQRRRAGAGHDDGGGHKPVAFRQLDPQAVQADLVRVLASAPKALKNDRRVFNVLQREASASRAKATHTGNSASAQRIAAITLARVVKRETGAA